MICWKDTYSKYDVFWGKGKYSLFVASCLRFWMCITKIHLDLNHKNTIMSDEHNVSSQSSMQYLPTRLPIIILWRVEKQLPPVRGVIVGAVCRQKNYIVFFWGICMAQIRKCFSFFWDLVQSFFFCGLRFWGWFIISVVLNVLCSLSSISMITSSILVMIGYVREIRHMYQFAVLNLEDFFKFSII